MPTDVLPLQHLAQRIQQQETELNKLRTEFEARQTQLTDLTRRKKELQAELQKIEAEIQSAGQVISPQAKPVVSKSKTKSAKRVTLAQFLVNCVKQAKKPITSKELADEIVRTKYPTTSQNIPALIDTRVQELVTKGILRRAEDRSGVVIGTAPAKPIGKKTASPAPKNGRMKATAVKRDGSAAPTGKTKKSLHDVLTEVLSKSSSPLTAQELVDQVLATGYPTTSKDFKNVIWVSIGKLPNVQRVPGKGFRLKKAAVSKK